MRTFIKHMGLTLLFGAFSFLLSAYDDARLMRYPDINGNQIVFVYAGDLWTVDANGGEARQLTQGVGTVSQNIARWEVDSFLGRV